MAKNEIGDYDEVDANNTDISGLPVSNSTLIAQLDDVVRAEMGALKRWFKTSLFRLRDSTDQTKLLAFDLSGLTTATTRTLTAPNASGTIALVAPGYTTTATAAGTTTLTVASTLQQYFTGTTTQTVVLPVTSTLVLGQQYRVVNNSTGLVTVQSSGANAVVVIPPGLSCVFTCILLTGTTAASWDFKLIAAARVGSVVQSVAGTYTANTNITTVIPLDTSIPQIGEGTEIITVNITPTSAANLLRIRLVGTASGTGANAPIVFAAFLGATANSFAADNIYTVATDVVTQFALIGDVVAGVTTAVAVSIRVGPGAAGTIRFNGNTSTQHLGAARAVRLVVEEIQV